MLVLTFQVRSRAQRFQKLVDHSAFHCHIGQCTGLLTIVLTIEATPDSTSRPLRIRVCQSRRDRTGLSSLRNCDKANTLGVRCRVLKKYCHNSKAETHARLKSTTVLRACSMSQCQHSVEKRYSLTSMNKAHSSLHRMILANDRSISRKRIPHVVEISRSIGLETSQYYCRHIIERAVRADKPHDTG